MVVDASFIEFKLYYSGTKDLPIGKHVVHDTSIFAGGHEWVVASHPRGLSCDDGEYLALHAITAMEKSKSVVISAVFHAFVKGGDGAPASPSSPHANKSGQVTCYDTPNGTPAWKAGWGRFMKRSDLESGGYLVDGCVTFVCGIIVLDNGGISVPSSDLGSHLGNLLDCADGSGGSDVSFSVGGETFRAHRAVLAARSPVFKAQLFGSMADATMPTITLHDIQPATFQVLLRFMYTDVLPTVKELEEGSSSTAAGELLQNLLAAADMYALDRLKLVCAQKLWEGVSVDNVAMVLGCAEMHSCPELKKRFIDFFVVEKNFKNAVLTEGYMRLMQSFPSMIDEIKSTSSSLEPASASASASSCVASYYRCARLTVPFHECTRES